MLLKKRDTELCLELMDLPYMEKSLIYKNLNQVLNLIIFGVNIFLKMKVLPQTKVVLNLPFTGTVEIVKKINSSNFFKNSFDVKEKVDNTFFIIENENVTLKVDLGAIHEFVNIQPDLDFNNLIWFETF